MEVAVKERLDEAEVVSPCAVLGTREAVTLASTFALAACGGGSGGSTSPTAAAPPVAAPPAPAMTDVQAARFLSQASMGASRADIAEVKGLGYDGWLNAQFVKPRTISLWDWLVANGYNTTASLNGSAAFDPAMWRSLITEPDQLRQRVTMALLDFLVVGIDGINLSWRAFAQAAYVDILFDGAFGNFRDLLEKITLNAAMGSYLTFLGNRKANPTTGAQPDENYARELMQLFTIGLRQLNMDGTEKQANGAPVETYGPADVSGLARIFTGLVLDSTDGSTPDRLRRPMIADARFHETGATTFLGVTVPAGTDTMGAIKIALDTIFAHPNVPPFVSKQLIQRLVTSNPSPTYVSRVTAVFADNGAGVRGDLKAVVRAILLDNEARSEANLANPSFGKLREPVMRLTAWARAFDAKSPSNAWAIGDTSSQANRLGQAKGRSPSVFNFYRPGYTPPNTMMADNNYVAPEFQITNELSTVAYVNFMQAVVQNGLGDFKADYSAIGAKAADPAALVDEVNLLLAAGQLTTTTRQLIVAAVSAIDATNTNGRVHTAILLTMASPDFIVHK